MLLRFALSALLLTAPALAQAPDDYARGVAARTGGDPAAARAIFERLLAADPANGDARLQLGLSLLALGDLDGAEAAFRQVLAVTPDYQDARDGLARVAERRRASIGTEWRWALDVEGSLADLERGQSDWKEAAAQLRLRTSEANVIGGRVEYARRFGLDDVYGELRTDVRLSDRVNIYVFGGATPAADFRPEWQIGAGAALKVGGTSVATLDLREGKYALGDVQTVSPGLEQYFAGGRAWITAKWINLFDEDGDYRTGYSLRGDVLASKRLRLFAGYADAPDTSEGTVFNTRSVFGGLSYDTGRTVWRASVGHDDRSRGFDQWTFGLGAGWKF